MSGPQEKAVHGMKDYTEQRIIKDRFVSLNVWISCKVAFEL
jgi:hypothetical protein